MPQSKTETNPNHYALHGHSVTIDYSLSDISGQPLLNFKVDTLSGTAHKKDIHVVKIDNVGQVITVALHPGPSADEGNPQFSFLLPDATLESGRETAFETIGFKTLTGRKGPAHQTYTPVSLKGKASIVESIAAKA
jgi:hypothetical protein